MRRDRDARDTRNKKFRRFKKKVCGFCVEKTEPLDYKNFQKLRRYVSDRGKMLARRQTGNCAKHQRIVAVAVKRARFMALLPYVAD